MAQLEDQNAIIDIKVEVDPRDDDSSLSEFKQEFSEAYIEVDGADGNLECSLSDQNKHSSTYIGEDQNSGIVKEEGALDDEFSRLSESQTEVSQSCIDVEVKDGKIEISSSLSGSQKPHNCTFCYKSFRTFSQLRIHNRTHTGEKPYHCTICNKSFTQVNGLTAHIRTHTGERPHECTMCDKSFRTSSHLAEHMAAHTGERPHECTVCYKSFAKSRNLKYHMKTHRDGTSHACTICNQSFTHPAHRDKHISTHTGKDQNIRIVNKEEVDLDEDVRLSQTQIKQKVSDAYIDVDFGGNLDCSICKQSFTSSSKLKKHLAHNGEKPHQCSFCNKPFRYLSHLNIHNRMHTGEKPYDCKTCSKSFTKSWHLKQHILRSAH